MASFSQRQGLSPVRSALQVNALDDESRRDIWNLLDALRDDLRDRWVEIRADNVYLDLWTGVLAQYRDAFYSANSVWPLVKQRVLTAPWFATFDIIEALVGAMARSDGGQPSGRQVAGMFNNLFEHHLIGYRFIDLEIAPIDSEEALEAVEAALASPHAAVRHHLERGLALLADRREPDYANSIKESVSAVEASVRLATGAATLGEGVKQLRSKGTAIHPALEKGWLAIYGWTSDASGIRHGGASAPEADQALAKYMLVSCSAFVSYLLEVGNNGTS